jgi:hypothetical protein
MDALSMAPATALRPGEGSAFTEQAIRPPQRLRTALRALLEAWDYAHDLTADPWEFALEIESLRRYQLTNSDLRWMVGRGLVQHAVEVAPKGDKRQFQRPERLVLSQSTCFVIAPAGIEAALDQSVLNGSTHSETPASVDAAAMPEAIPPLPPAQTSKPVARPTWNRDRQELTVGKVLALRLTIPAPHAESLLATFEEQDWPEEIAAPMPMFLAPTQLQRAIATLNRRLRTPILRFEALGTSAVRWRFTAEYGRDGE